MTSDFLLLQKIRNGNNHAGNQFVEKVLFFYLSILLSAHPQSRMCRRYGTRNFCEVFSGALMSGAEIGKAKSYLYSIAGNIIKKLL